MTSDKFVKITLVVIAVSLFKIAFFDVSTIQNAYANVNLGQVHKIAICNESGSGCATLTELKSGNHLNTYNLGR